jgi:hypothetical protein
MDNIIEPTIDYDFSKLYLGPPTNLTGGAYFTRLMYNNNKQLYIQTPKSLTKQGFIKSGKKTYTDLMFDNNDTVFINWMENLETKCQELIFSKSQTWFETKLEKEDIESAFTSPFKIFKSGKYYLLRVNVKTNIKIYDEKDQICNCDDVTSDKTIISILEIQGIKFTSRNFQIEIELKQAMVVSPDPFLDECFIKKPIRTQSVSNKDIMLNNNDDDANDDNDDKIAINTFINESAKDLAQNLMGNGSLEKNKTVNNFDTNDTIDLDDSDSFHQSKSNNNDVNNLLNNSKNILHSSSNNGSNISSNSIINNSNTNANVVSLDITDFTPEPDEELEKELSLTINEDFNSLKEVDLSSTLENNLETITLKKPNQVYYEIYQKAREKAKEAKKNALLAYLEMKNIKKTYMLEDIDNSDSEFDDYVSKDSASELSESDAESLEDNY